MKHDKWTIDKLLKTFDTTIKEDDTTKLILFHAMILNYTEEDQLNIAINAAASTGKSYNANEIAKYFPEEDIEMIGYATPQSFFYEHGKVVDNEGNEIPPKNEYVEQELQKWMDANPELTEHGQITKWKERKATKKREIKTQYDKLPKTRLVDLHQKVIVFVDQPHEELLKRVRPLLSHDNKTITSKHVNRAGEDGGFKTLSVTLRGYPTVIFCSAEYLRDAQEQTRVVILSPDTTQRKQEEAIKLGAEFLADRESFRNWLREHPERNELTEHIRKIKELKISQIILKPELINRIRDSFLEKDLKPRHQRDFKYVVALAKAHCMLNYTTRKKEGSVLHANIEDVYAGMELYAPIEVSNELGLPPEAYRIYLDIIMNQAKNPVSYSTLKYRYQDKYGRSIDHYRLLKVLDALAIAGLIEKDLKHPDDLRIKCIREIGEVAEDIDTIY